VRNVECRGRRKTIDEHLPPVIRSCVFQSASSEPEEPAPIPANCDTLPEDAPAAPSNRGERGALECGNAAIAEDAFFEAPAHDSGSVRGALGMEALCDRLGRTEEAQHFGAVAHRCWNKADPKLLESLAEEMTAKAKHVRRQAVTSTSMR
jgi:hypothetical protein